MNDFIVLGSEHRVDAWSSRRLPFEPRGRSLEFRRALRNAIVGLTPDGLLRCVYASDDRAFCDTENVLIYNVGTGSFRHLVEAGLVFERGFDVPPAPSAETFGHYHSYVSAERDAPACWATHRVISQWRARVPKNRASAAAWWLATSSALSTAVNDIIGRPFRLRLRVAQGAMAVHSEVKPMLDGIIAAQHVDLTPSSLAVQRLSATLNVPARDLERILRADGPLGIRAALVRPYRAGIKWNPADDLCVACAVVVDASLAAGVVEGELLADSPA